MEELEEVCKPLIRSYEKFFPNENLSYMDFYLTWHRYALDSKSWLYPHITPKITKENTQYDFFASININSFLKLKWPFTINTIFLSKLKRCGNLELQKQLVMEFITIAKGDFGHANVISIGPCVYNCFLLKSLEKNKHLLFSINPIFEQKESCFSQYLRFDVCLREVPSDFLDITIKSLQEAETLDKS